jgi:CUE domain
MESIATQLLADILQKSTVLPDKNNHFLTATDLYRIGLVTYNLLNHHPQQQEQDDQHRQPSLVTEQASIVNNVQTAALAILQGLPVNIRQGLFDDLQEALQQVISHHHHRHEREDEDLKRALESFIGIWSLLLVVTTTASGGDKRQTTLRQRLSLLRWPNEVEISFRLIELYQKQPHDVPKEASCQSLILEFLSLVWLSPTTIYLANSNSNSKSNASSSSSSSEYLEDFLTILNSLQEQDAIWQDLIDYHEQHHQPSSSSWRQDLVQSLTLNHDDNVDATQRDYVSSLLMHEKTPASKNNNVMPRSVSKPISNKRAVVGQNTRKDAMQERIDQVRAVIPDVGEGFVELALSLYQGDAERAVTALLEPELPPGLQYVDKHLPRRKNPNAMPTLNDDDKDAQAAKQVTKKALQAEEERQKAEAAAIYYVSKTAMADDYTSNNTTARHMIHHDEYDDEYDDQWDADFAGTTAGADDGLYDHDDYHAILAYNRAMKQVVGEQSFWDEQRNTNRKQQSVSSNSASAAADEATASSSYRGPDKIKGGRVPGRGRGGGGGDVSAAAAADGGGGRGGGGNNKQGVKGKKDSDVAAAGGKGNTQGKSVATASNTTTSNNDKPSKPNQRHKANKLASRREQQKQSMNKRSGGM